MDPQTCPRCGIAVVNRIRGRPRIWCTDRCRKLASEEHRAAERGAIGLQVHDRIVEKRVREVVRTPPSMTEAIEKVLGNREAVRTVLATLVHRQQQGKWSSYDRKLWWPQSACTTTDSPTNANSGDTEPLRRGTQHPCRRGGNDLHGNCVFPLPSTDAHSATCAGSIQ